MPKIVYKLSANHRRKIDITAEKIVHKERIPAPTKKVKLFYAINQKYTENYHNMDMDYNITDACIGCGICSNVCPVENIVMKDGKPTFEHRCEQCMACIHACPKRALNYKDKTQKRSRYIHPDITIKDLGVHRNNSTVKRS